MIRKLLKNSMIRKTLLVLIMVFMTLIKVYFGVVFLPIMSVFQPDILSLWMLKISL